MADTEELNEEAGLDQFQLEIQKVTEFVKDPKKAKQEEQEELNRTITTSIVPSTTSTLSPSSPSLITTPTLSSTELSVSYSDISDDQPYIHGAILSSPKAIYHRDSAIPTVVEIHDLLTTRDQTLFFIPEIQDSDHSDGDGEIMNDEELSEERKKHDRLRTDQENKPKKQLSFIEVKKKMKDKKKKFKRKLKKSNSERGLTFAISEGHVFFNWSAFCREFLYNFFHILALPIVLWKENKSGAISRMYWPCHWRFYGILGFLNAMAFFYLTIMFFCFRYGVFDGTYTQEINGTVYECGGNQNPSDVVKYSYAITVYIILYLGRTAVVAIKWAYLPPQIFQLMRQKPLSSGQQSMIHLLTGWVNHENKSGLAREIGQSCARLELDINSLKFAFRDESKKRNAKSVHLNLTHKCVTYTTYGNLLVPYIIYVSSREIAKWSKFWKCAAFIAAPIICICPLVARVLEQDSIQYWWACLVWYGLLWKFLWWACTAQCLSILIQFCAVIALDFRRRYQLIRFSTRIIELKRNAFDGLMNFGNYKHHLWPKCAATKEGRKNLDSAYIQTLDLSDAETMYNWSLLRALFLDFGLRFLRREEAILGIFVVSMIIIVAFYFTLIYAEILEVNPFDLAFCLTSTMAVLAPALSALRYATRINQKVSDQRYILADKRLKLENERLELLRNGDAEEDEDDEHMEHIPKDFRPTKRTVQSIGKACTMLEKVVSLLEVDSFRIRLLGYTVDTTVTGLIAFVVGSIGFLVARLLLGDDAEGLEDF